MTQSCEKQEKEYVYTSTLSRDYGLTPKMVAELDGPDMIRENPHYSNAYPAGLYAIKRVEAWIEANKDRVEKARESRQRRSAAAKRVQEQKRAAAKVAEEQERAARFEEAEEWVRTVEIVLEVPLTYTLFYDACVCHKWRDGFDYRHDKGLVAYVRGQMTNFPSLRRELKDRGCYAELHHVLLARADAFVAAKLVVWDADGAATVTADQEDARSRVELRLERDDLGETADGRPLRRLVAQQACIHRNLGQGRKSWQPKLCFKGLPVGSDPAESEVVTKLTADDFKQLRQQIDRVLPAHLNSEEPPYFTLTFRGDADGGDRHQAFRIEHLTVRHLRQLLKQVDRMLAG